MVMRHLRISCVGHSQVFDGFVDTDVNTTVRVFRKRGGHVFDLLDQPEVRNVLSWQHDVCFLWIGSNDIRVGVSPEIISEAIINVARKIRDSTGAQVKILGVEPRVYPGPNPPIQNNDYITVAGRINNRLDKHTFVGGVRLLKLSSREVRGWLGVDGVHFSRVGQTKVKGWVKKEVDFF